MTEAVINSTTNQEKPEPIPKTDVEVKKISSGLMLAQYYNSDSEDDDDDDNKGSNGCETSAKQSVQTNKDTQKNLPTISTNDENTIPSGIKLPPPELRIIIDKTASYVLKNGKDFEDILRAKNDQRFTFLQYKDPYNKYYTFKVTGAISVCPNPDEMMAQNMKKELIQSHIKSVGKYLE